MIANRKLTLWFVCFNILFMALLCSCSWTPQEIAKEAAWGAIHTIDWRQTRTIAKNPALYTENNPALGSHPSTSKVDFYMIGTGILHPVVTHLLPRKHYLFGWKWNPRAVFQNVTLIGSGACVLNNFAIGIKMDL